ncbi:hypothetical protein GCM10017044_04130 [Kordiimonas sediminis]|uniref:Alpha/beta hydrolase fold-3 domain-containing protein n=1 Tax=Kordiimonas sediminis TaxID=1735581 RepID=A0A919AJZ4_9PROT|nr:alpha/beta hydrolase [Kordiimonas sediminis]GHF13318.1 hypothetical protein GCM10017044_04130 [Kordiimonas sediminis]
MVLDTQTKQLLDEMAAGGRFVDGLPPLPDYRKAAEEIMISLAVPSSEIDSVENVRLTGGTVLVRRYVPNDITDAENPAILFAHGGGWALGTLDGYDSFCRRLAKQSGMQVFSVEYRLAPEHPFPAGLNDVIEAYKALRLDAQTYNIDRDRILLCGDSAGGNLVAATCEHLSTTDIPMPAGLAMIYPMTDVSGQTDYPSRRLFGTGEYFLEEAMIDWSTEQYLTDKQDRHNPLVSPVLSDNLGLYPKTLIITAGYDPLRDEGIAFYDRMVKAGGQATHVNFETTIHAFLSFDRVLPVAEKARDVLIEHLKSMAA